MKQDCCESFNKLAPNLQWVILDNKYIMPNINVNGIKYRVNFCPSCGKNIRDIELDKK